MINTKLQSIIDTKSAIGNAIVNKGGTITSETPFFNYASEIDNISTGSVLTGNATETDVAIGKTFYSNDANTILTGTASLIEATGNDVNTSLFSTSIYSFGNVRTVATNNGFAYAGGYFFQNAGVRKYHESNLVLVGNTPNFGTQIQNIITNNGFIYATGTTVGGLRKYFESNLALASNATLTQFAYGLATNNGFIYVANGAGFVVSKYHESNLAFVGNTASYGDQIYSIAINNGFLYAAGWSSGIRRYHEGNLVFVNNSAVDDLILKIKIKDDFIYTSRREVKKYHEGNLVLANTSATFSWDTWGLNIDSNYATIITGGSQPTIIKLHTSNLTNAVIGTQYGTSTNFDLFVNNNNLFVGSSTGYLQKYYLNTPFVETNGVKYYKKD